MVKKNKFIYAAFGSAVRISSNLAHRIYDGLTKTGYPAIWAFSSRNRWWQCLHKTAGSFKKYSFLELKSMNCIYI